MCDIPILVTEARGIIDGYSNVPLYALTAREKALVSAPKIYGGFNPGWRALPYPGFTGFVALAYLDLNLLEGDYSSTH